MSSTSHRELPPSWSEWCEFVTSGLCERDVLRSLRTITPQTGQEATAVLVDRCTHSQWTENMPSVGEVPELSSDPPVALAMFATNDYLGLSMHPAVRAASAAAANAFGCGPRSSALVCGYTASHRALETAVAKLKNTEECLLFPSGYAANMSVLNTLADAPECEIFSDELNHASIVDGCLLASRGRNRASMQIYRHNDLGHLDALLSASLAPRKLIISDSLFSMDGNPPCHQIACTLSSIFCC